ncbi:MAG: DUF6090 family protein [Cyclobacteriaceae bacterium]
MNNKFTTYFLYGIGEIVLVVIGILIAVSIDDWNQGRKEAKQQVEILKNLRDDLKHNLIEIRRVHAEDSAQVVKNRLLLDFMLDPASAYHDSLQYYFGNISRYDVFSPRKMTYEAVKSKGLELIQNQELRSEIIKLYDEKYPLNTVMLDIRRDIHINTIKLNNKRFLTMKNVGQMVPNSFAALKQDQEFTGNLSYIAAEGANFEAHLQSMINQTDLVYTAVVSELQNLDSQQLK